MALSANLSLSGKLRNTRSKSKLTLTIKTNQVIYQGALVAVTRTGQLARPCANAPTLYFGGVALECSTRSFPITGDGTKTVDVYKDLEMLLTASGITDGMHGNIAYAVDDEKVWPTTSTLGPQVGRVAEFVSATQSWVKLGANALVDSA